MPSESKRVHETVDQFKIQALNFAYQFIKNGNIRAEYIDTIKSMSDDTLKAYKMGRLSADKAAKLAQQSRNTILNAARARQTTLGRSLSRSMKEEGRALDSLLDSYTAKRFGKTFKELDKAQADEVFVDVIKASGRARRSATTLARRMKAGGRVFWVITIAVAVYNVGASENKLWATGREVATAGGGFGGGAAGGAVAGIWFGPVGIAIGIVVGGVLGSVLADEAFLEVVGAERVAANKILDAHTTFFYTDEDGIAKDLLRKYGINMDRVYIVFLELDANYSGDADDVARLYYDCVKKKGGPVFHALKKNKALRNLLIRILDEGWTISKEQRIIEELRQLGG